MSKIFNVVKNKETNQMYYLPKIQVSKYKILHPSFYNVVANDDESIIVAIGNTIYYSLDYGDSWQEAILPYFKDNDTLKYCCYHNGLFIVASNKCILTSVDGKAWVNHTIANDVNIVNLKKLDDGYVYAMSSILVDTTNSKILRSKNGFAWEELIIPNTNIYIQDIEYVNNTYFLLTTSSNTNYGWALYKTTSIESPTLTAIANGSKNSNSTGSSYTNYSYTITKLNRINNTIFFFQYDRKDSFSSSKHTYTYGLRLYYYNVDLHNSASNLVLYGSSNVNKDVNINTLVCSNDENTILIEVSTGEAFKIYPSGNYYTSSSTMLSLGYFNIVQYIKNENKSIAIYDNNKLSIYNGYDYYTLSGIEHYIIDPPLSDIETLSISSTLYLNHKKRFLILSRTGAIVYFNLTSNSFTRGNKENPIYNTFTPNYTCENLAYNPNTKEFIMISSQYNTNYAYNILSSYNAKEWSIKSTINNTTIGNNSIITFNFVNNKYIIKTNDNYVYSSDNLITWNKSTSALTNLNSMDIAYGNGVYVTAYNSSSIYYSNDLINWNKTSSNNFEVYGHNINFTNGKFIVAYGDVVSYSINGTNWAKVKLPEGIGLSYSKVVYGNRRYVCTSYNTYPKLAISYDLNTWEVIDTPFRSNIRFLMYDKLFIAASDRYIYTSYNGRDWNEHNLPYYARFTGMVVVNDPDNENIKPGSIFINTNNNNRANIIMNIPLELE